MVLVLRALLFVGGLLFCLMGVGFLLNPATMGGDFGLSAAGAHGLASIRADMTAFFLVAGGCMIWGGWARKGDPLLVSAALFGIAFIGRVVGLIQDGTFDGYLQPMIVEATAVVITLVASRVLPHSALTGDGG